MTIGRRPLLLGFAALAWSPALGAQRLGLKGYDPVAYFTLGKPTQGKADFEAEFDGATYRFASAEHRDRFRSDPDRYAPQFAGACAGGVSMGMKIEANPENFLIVDGKLFVFTTPVAGESPAKVKELLAQAGHQWPALQDKPFR